MKFKYFIIALALLSSLFVYLFYRTEQTVVNWVVIQFMGWDTFQEIRSGVNAKIGLTGFQVYSLPEALWVLSLTLLSKRYKVRFAAQEISLVFLPIILVLGFEFFQWMHWSNGSADLNDLWGALLCWALGMAVFPEREPKVYLAESLNIHALLCAACYAVVYLAHVRH